ncbi:MAG: YqaA family protein [Alphaproteobacteria bacterium]
MHTALDLTLLFFASFLAATVFPAQSEGMLAAMHLTGAYNVYALVLVATVGNVLGSCINWLLGKYITHFQHRKWFPVKAAALHKAEATYKKYGVWTLLFAWVPVLGDPLTVAAGFLRTPLPLFLLLVTIGKAARYIAIISVL